ncbi:MAG TPA: hypothetical protein VMZ27_06535, partial [Candidatus Saccharimonadales bacterium]|nr:hypothetical protein [Candidatus Saccharimonadales bacterium]
ISAAVERSPRSAGILACCFADFPVCFPFDRTKNSEPNPSTEHVKHETENSSLRLSTLNRAAGRTNSQISCIDKPSQSVAPQPLLKLDKARHGFSPHARKAFSSNLAKGILTLNSK